MKYCDECGAKMKDNAKICKECGFLASTDTEDSSENDTFKEKDKFSVAWEWFGFLTPLIGLVLYIVWRRDLPCRAYSVGKGALFAYIVRLILGVLLLIVYLFYTCYNIKYYF